MKLSDIVLEFKKYLGYGQLISQKDMDQGDTAQRCGHVLSYLKLVGADSFNNISLDQYYDLVFSELQIQPGIYRRSSDPSYWGSDPRNLSRDQRSGLESAMLVFGDTKKLKESKDYIIGRSGFHQNSRAGVEREDKRIPDIVSPGELRLYSTGIGRYFFDLMLFGDLMLRKDNNYDTDNMLALQMLICYKIKPTFLSKLAMKKYLKTNFMDRVYDYHRIDGFHNGCEPIAWLTDYAYLKLVPGYQSKQQFE